MKQEIKDRFTGKVLFSCEAESFKVAVELAVERFANLRSANLESADLRSANLESANLESANLRFADLRFANLRSANLESANLESANLESANLESANLRSAIGNMEEVKSLQIEGYMITFTADFMWVGCHGHKIFDWWEFTYEQIKKMDAPAERLWRKYRKALKLMVETSLKED